MGHETLPVSFEMEQQAGESVWNINRFKNVSAGEALKLRQNCSAHEIL